MKELLIIEDVMKRMMNYENYLKQYYAYMQQYVDVCKQNSVQPRRIGPGNAKREEGKARKAIERICLYTLNPIIQSIQVF